MDPITDYELIATEYFDPLLVADEVLCQAILYEFGVDACAPIYTFDEPGAGETAGYIAAVALAIEELDALIRADAPVGIG